MSGIHVNELDPFDVEGIVIYDAAGCPRCWEPECDEGECAHLDGHCEGHVIAGIQL